METKSRCSAGVGGGGGCSRREEVEGEQSTVQSWGL